MNWIDVNDRLPERGDDVLVVMKDVDGFTHTEIRWRSIHKDSVVDENGFAIYPPVEEIVLAWLPIPKYVKKRQEMSRELIKVSTYARMNNITVQAVYKKIHKGELKVEKIDGMCFIVKEEYGK